METLDCWIVVGGVCVFALIVGDIVWEAIRRRHKEK